MIWLMDKVTFSAYGAFAENIKRRYRYALDREHRSFLESVTASSRERMIDLEEGTMLWRARLGHDGHDVFQIDDERSMTFPRPYCADDMKPLRDRAKEGRANAKGIPCLYCSTEMKTAINEVRPWLDSLVCVAEVMTIRPMRLIDCSDGALSFTMLIKHLDDPGKLLWSDLNHAFSEPVSGGDDTADYAPTQVIAEEFRMNGADGIKYSSRLGEGKTITLFDLESARVVSRQVFRVTKPLLFDVSPEGEPVYDQDHPIMRSIDKT